MEEMNIIMLRPGEPVQVQVDCARCESYRWRAVNPARNIRRALDRLEKLNVENLRDDEQMLIQEAMFFLGEGAVDARHLAEHAQDEAPSELELFPAHVVACAIDDPEPHSSAKMIPRGIYDVAVRLADQR